MFFELLAIRRSGNIIPVMMASGIHRQVSLRCFVIALAILLIAGAPCVAADSSHGAAKKKVPTLVIKGAFVRLPTDNANSAVVYMKITNNSDKAERLTAAASPVAEQVELHKITKSYGMRRMHEIEEIVLPAHSMVPLKFGTYHLMLVGLNRPLKIGEKVPLELTFSPSGKVKLLVPVANIKTGKR